MIAETRRNAQKIWLIWRKGAKDEKLAKCVDCGRKATLLCDFVVAKSLGGNEIFCDAPICEMHARRESPDARSHLCDKHFKEVRFAKTR